MMTMVALRNAKLCVSCEFISDATKETCPHCGGRANWLSLGKLLSGKKEDGGYGSGERKSAVVFEKILDSADSHDAAELALGVLASGA